MQRFAMPIFMPADMPNSAALPPSMPIYSRAFGVPTGPTLDERIAEIQRVGGSPDINLVLAEVGKEILSLQRALTASQVPTRENLEAEASLLIPIETPIRNMLPRRSGSGVASKWEQLISLGGGYGAATTSGGTGNGVAATTLTVASVNGFVVGDTIMVGTFPTAESHIITAIGAGQFTLSVGLTNAQVSQPVVKIMVEPGGGAAQQAFFAETGAPATRDSVYNQLIKGYKLLGSIGSITGFAMAGGATYMNQRATEMTNAIRNTMLNEEDALINAVSTVTVAPWGDGTNALAYDGMLASITTANGTPVQQIQSGVGALTTAHIDQQLIRLWLQGAQGLYMIMNGQEISSLAHIAEQGGAYRVVLNAARANVGISVSGYIHPVTGEEIPIIPSRFLSPGTIIYGCKNLPDGKPAADVDVLPQVQLPELAPNQDVQGYVAQELAPTTAAPQVYPFLVSLYSVFRMKSALHFAVDTGVTPV